ncbi:MAG TPA: hypothetical protein VF487_19240 [Chitinophagaceae bacterium]
MKNLLIFPICLLLVFCSCKKSDSTSQNAMLDQSDKLSQTTHQLPNAEETRKNYQTLMSKFKSGKISFEEYRSGVQVLLAPYKAFKGGKKAIHIAARTTGAWVYEYPQCPTPADSIACLNFYYYDCMSFCDDMYYTYADAAQMEENAAYADYQIALGNCNNIVDPAYKMICTQTAQNAYAARMGAVFVSYEWASFEYNTCTESCPQPAN